jgi:pilus assembly protein TadC
MLEKADQESLGQGAVEFLIAEYNEISQENRRLRQEGIARLNFFITITSSVLAVLAFLSQENSVAIAVFQAVAIGILLLLFFVGLDTFRFTIRRDIKTDLNIRAIARIRRFFALRNPKIQQYLTWQYHDEPTAWITSNTSNVRLTAQYILSFICALIAGLLLNLIGMPLAAAIALGVIVLVGSFIILQRYAARQFQEARSQAKRSMRFPLES